MIEMKCDGEMAIVILFGRPTVYDEIAYTVLRVRQYVPAIFSAVNKTMVNAERRRGRKMKYGQEE